MNNTQVISMIISTYGLWLFSFIYLIGSAILWLRIRTISTVLFFFGSLFSSVFAVASIFLIKLGTPVSYGPVAILVPFVGTILQSIGLLFYSLSLPKKNRPLATA